MNKWKEGFKAFFTFMGIIFICTYVINLLHVFFDAYLRGDTLITISIDTYGESTFEFYMLLFSIFPMSYAIYRIYKLTRHDVLKVRGLLPE